MAESILSGSVEKIVGTLISLAGKEISLAWGLESDLRSLKTTLSTIKAVIIDAEEQQTANHQITNWLSQLRHALYDAEDVLDDFQYQLLRKEVVNKVRRLFSSSNSIAYRLRIGHRIKDLRLRLDQIAADKAQFNLVDRPDIGPVQLREREMTDSHFSSSDAIGRDEDRESIVEFLMDSLQGHANDNNAEVIPIVGIGGLGKTTIAKMVFNDPKVVDHFHSKLWVCLGDMKEFDVNQVMSKISRDNIQEKRFFLVLDDVWDVNRDKWLKFKSLLSNCGKGSKILVTTRFDLVARCVGTVQNPYILEGLPQEECVSLFKKLAFASEDEVDEKLMTIGEDIVKKCKGVPLAIRCLGSLLFKESDENKWLAVRDNNIWQIEEGQKSILPILKFSYDHLPSHLKQCFVYCSIFPEDYEFQAQFLISFWMAHGLLQSPNENQRPEDVGKQYIKELLSRGFFQDSTEMEFVLGWTFKMHDLVRDLACSLGQGEFLIVNDNNKAIGENVRHVYFERLYCSRNSSNVIRSVFGNSRIVLKKSCIHQFKCLRFLCLELPYDVKELPDTFGTLKHLRFLDLSMCSSLERLPDSISKLHNLQTLNLSGRGLLKELPRGIGTLKHLRSLDLSDCIRLEKLPGSISKLHNLQNLNLSGCRSLKELPEKMGELVSLRYLWITTQQKHLPRNNRIECLPCLQFLRFSHCHQLETLFERTENLTSSLRTLVVQKCKRLVSLFSLSGSAVTNYSLPALEVLCIDNCMNLNVSQCLHLPRLGSLAMRKVDLTKGLPEWIHGCSPTLQFFELWSCWDLEALPEWLPNLTSLRTLSINFCELKSLPQGMDRLTALKTLEISGCPMLVERCEKERGEDWPKIAHVPNILIQ